jgi:hypothetical protein
LIRHEANVPVVPALRGPKAQKTRGKSQQHGSEKPPHKDFSTKTKNAFPFLG